MSKPIILCVDDEASILDSVQVELEQTFADNYEYEIAESAEEALELIEELSANNIPILLIVSDWLMPGMKGDEFLICVHQKLPLVPKIMLTGQADKNAITRAYTYANLCKCVYKPIDSYTLVETVKFCLGTNRLQ